ncbi:MAG: hypothetical protein JXA94_00930 [Parachlamydiales bacterium]|nr:hypothetical protein [Parachlamydiales bacterium]
MGAATPFRLISRKIIFKSIDFDRRWYGREVRIPLRPKCLIINVLKIIIVKNI